MAKKSEVGAITQLELIMILEGMATNFSTYKEFAKHLGISPQYLADILNKQRLPGPKLLDALGMKRVIAYVYKD